MRSEIVRIEESSGSNLFKDIDQTNSNIELMKTSLASKIIQTLNERKLTVRKAGEIAQVQYADISRVRNSELDKFTLDWLAKLLIRLNPDIDIKISYSKRTLADINSLTYSRIYHVF